MNYYWSKLAILKKVHENMEFEFDEDQEKHRSQIQKKLHENEMNQPMRDTFKVFSECLFMIIF